MDNLIIPVSIQSKKLVINNSEEFYSAIQCFKIIEFFKGFGWDVENELVIYQSNMLNTIGPPIYNVDHILLRTYQWLYPVYGRGKKIIHDFGRHHIEYSDNTLSQQEFPWVKEDVKRLFEKNRPYYYLCYNGQLRPHRQYILNEFFKRDIIKKGLVSCLASPSGHGLHTTECEYTGTTKQAKDCCGGDQHALLNSLPHGERPDNIDGIKDFLKLSHHPHDVEIYPTKEFIGSIPMILDIEPDGISNSLPTEDFKLNGGEFQSHRTSDVSHFKDSYFSVVTESNFLSDDVDEDNDYNGECMFITEKTYRALCFHPTIIAGNKGILEYLRKLGFKTFPKFFDESYDDIENDHDRMLAVVKEVDRICKLPIDEVHQMAKEEFETVLHNQEVMKKFGNSNFALTELGAMYEFDLFEKT